MKAELRRLTRTDGADLTAHAPDEPDFAVPIRIIAGPLGGPGEESFDATVCTPGWLANKLADRGIIIGRHHIIVLDFDYIRIKAFIEKYVSRCTGSNWKEVAEKLGRLGYWEFEDYEENERC